MLNKKVTANSTESAQQLIGIGETPEFNLRVSTAVLTQTFFREIDEYTGKTRLSYVLERKATCERNKKDPALLKEIIKGQPLGGASTIKKPEALFEEIGTFNYDNEKAQKNNDFRLQIRTSDWEKVKQFCLKNFTHQETDILEATCHREVTEELLDALEINYEESDSLSLLQQKLLDELKAEKIEDIYTVINLGPQVQSEPSLTDRMGVSGSQTVRVFNIQNVEIINPVLINRIKENTARVSNEELQAKAKKKAIANEAKGKKFEGKASALTIVPYSELQTLINAAGEADINYQGITIIDSVAISLRNNTLLDNLDKK